MLSSRAAVLGSALALALALTPGAHADPADPVDPATRVGVKMMPSAGTRGGDFLASDGYGSFMTTPFGQIGLCWDVGFTFHPYEAELDPAHGPFDPSGVLDFGGWGMIPWYGLACGDQIVLFQGPVGDTSGLAVNFNDLGPELVAVDTFTGPDRATRHTELTLPAIPGLAVSLDQTARCASLEKVFRFTNTSDHVIAFRMDTTMDADLQWETHPGWAQWGYCHNWGRFVAPNEVRMYSRDKDIWTSVRVEPDPEDAGLHFDGCRVWANGCMGGAAEFGRVFALHGYPPEQLNGIYNGSNASADLDHDGWQDWEGDNALSCQGTFTLAPGQTSTWRQIHSAGPSHCGIHADAGPDQAVSTGPLEQCVAEVTLDASASNSTGAPPLQFIWRDASDAVVGTDAVATVALGSPQGQRTFEVSACDHLCQPVTEPVAIRQPSDGGVAAPCDSKYCYYPAGTTDCELACETDTAVVDLDVDAGPSDATCDGVDDDCDGAIDDDYRPTTSVCGVGRCAGTTGELVCEDGGTRDTCAPDARALDGERCNGVDDDCDGATDEGFDLGRACTVGQSACTSAGHTVCASDGLGVACDAPVVNGASERCNGLDDDCDGATDEDFALGQSCTIGLGACARSGVRACVAATGLAACDAPVVTGSAELCNGTDDDCDGATDEGACAALDTRITAGPDAVTAQTTASFTYVDPVTPGNPRFECALDGGAWAACDGGAEAFEGLGDGPHVLLVRAVGPTGAVDPTPAFWTWRVDRGPPDTWVLAGPDDPSQSGDAAFVFGSNVADPSAWYCAIDPATPASIAAAAWFPCDATWAWEGLADGAHTVFVYVVNELGVADPTPASYAWLVDSTAPGTTVSGPAATCAAAATFTFASPGEAGVTAFRCRVDGGAWVDCPGGTFTAEGLADGPHVFEVAAVDAHGNVDPTPARALFVAYRVAPETRIALAPSDPSQDHAAVFAFDADRAGATFACALDAAALAPCASPVALSGLADGPHRFTVVATVGGCLADPTPATHAWTIDASLPETAWLAIPPALVGADDASAFTYEDPTDPALTTFECRLDGAVEWTRCDDGALDLGVLPVGPHALEVRACEAIGGEVPSAAAPAVILQCDPTPAFYTWEVTASPCPLDAEAPMIVCAPAVTLECVAGAAVLDLDALAPEVSDACAPIGTATSAEASAPYGQSPVVFDATDGNGNRASCVTAVSVVDRAAPTITCPPAVALVAPEDACGAVATLAAATVIDACWATDALAVFSDAPPVFGPGATVVTMTAVDPAGNTARCTTTVTVTDETPVSVQCEPEVTRAAPADACAWSGTLEARATDNCAVDAMVVERTNRYAVGLQDVEFTATDEAGNHGACTTHLTVVDATPPALACPAATLSAPGVVTVAASDACTAIVAIADLACTAVAADGTRTSLPGAACPAAHDAAASRSGSEAEASVEVTARVPGASLEVAFTATATDPSGGAATRACTVTLPSSDADGSDGVVALGGASCAGGDPMSLALGLAAAALVMVARARRAGHRALRAGRRSSWSSPRGPAPRDR